MFKRFHSGLLPLAKLLDVDILPLTTKITSIYNKRKKFRGNVDAVKFLKELCTNAERYALHQEVRFSSWTKTDKDGFPRILGKTFKSYLRHEEDQYVIISLSVMRSVDLLHLPISKDIDSIIKPSLADNDVLEDIFNFIPIWIKRLNKPFKLGRLRYHYTARGGPNGPALMSSDSDISAVMNDSKLYEAIRMVESKLENKYPMPTVEVINPDCIHSKLTQISEKAGKTRTIAIIDYYSQRCLKPLHKSLMALLESLVSDGTYSHMKVGKFAEKMTLNKEFIYCADLTAFTDRFPAIIQKVLLSHLLKDDELTEALWTILADRTFKLQWSGEDVRYSAGQPMGAYSSWPLCSLAHHLVVEYSANLAGVQNCKEIYRLIGDDVIITERRTAESYIKVITALGVDINLSKTVLSPQFSEFSGAEVAKQVYLNGRCLTPLTPGFIRDLKKPYMINSCIRNFIDRYGSMGTGYPSMLIDSYFLKGRKRRLAWLLGSNPITGVIKPNYLGYKTTSPWRSVDTDLALFKYSRILLAMLTNKSRENMGKLFAYIQPGGGPWKDRACDPPKNFEYITQDISDSLTEIQSTLVTGILNPEGLNKLFEDVDFIPDPMLPYQERKKLRQRQLSFTIVKLYESISGQGY